MKKVGFINAADTRWLSRVCGSAIIAIAAVTAMVDCSSSDDPATNGQGGSAPTPPKMEHTPPDETKKEMCVICHTCGTDGVTTGITTIDKTHDVCNSCHTADGGVKVHTDGGCQWEMDCDANPPVINCDDCHSIAEVNDMCEFCHVY